MGYEVTLANLASQVTAPGSQITFSQNVNVLGTTNTFSGAINVGNNINMYGDPTSGNNASYIQMPFIYNADMTNKWNVPAFNWKHLGFYQLRDGNQYLDIKTSNAYNSLMYMFHVVGYLYNQGEVISYTSGYSYTAPNTILNQYTHNLGNQSISSYRTASPSGGGYLCLKINRGTSSYSEGQLNVYFHSHDTSAQNSISVVSWAQNQSSGNYYSS
jgi:hypothetical protein